MLKSFSVKNYKGFKDEIRFDLSNNREYGYNEYLIKNGIVNKSIIYGKNASGKTNFGYALFDIVSHLTDKYHPRTNINFLNADSNSNLAEFKYNFKFNNIDLRYEYGKKGEMDLSYEKIYFNDRLVFDFNIEENILLLSNLDVTENIQWEQKNDNLSAIKYMITTFTMTDDYPIKQMSMFVNKMLWFRRCDKENNFIGYNGKSGTIDEYLHEHNLSEKFQAFLNNQGINEKVVVELQDGKPIIKFKYAKHTLAFGHAASSGTKALLLVFYWMEVAFKDVSLVFMDEFDAFYHNELSFAIVKYLFESSNFQVILTTHNLSLISNIEYRPDIYYVLNKNKLTNFPDSTDRVIRQAHNLEKMYKAGIFENE